MSINF